MSPGNLLLFFFEKKNQKTFANWGEPIRRDRSQNNQKFLLLFFGIEVLALLESRMAKHGKQSRISHPTHQKSDHSPVHPHELQIPPHAQLKPLH